MGAVEGNIKPGISFTELDRPAFGQRWLFRLSELVRFSYQDGVAYEKGEASTSLVVVSWGRMGDACIFPSNDEGWILDMYGYKSWDYYIDADEAMNEWLESYGRAVAQAADSADEIEVTK